MSIENIVACLEQKVILLTQIWDLTKQIEVRCMQDDIQLDDFLEQRGIFIARVNKCNDLIARLTKELPAEQQKQITQLLQRKLKDGDCKSKEEQRILALSNECRVILQKAAVLDHSAREKIQTQCDDLRRKINQERRTDGHDGIFQNIK